MKKIILLLLLLLVVVRIGGTIFAVDNPENLNVKPIITNFSVLPDTGISKDNPAIAIANVAVMNTIANGNVAIASANIAVEMENISQVEFGVIDKNNLVGIPGNGSAILSFNRNLTGVEGIYQSNLWSGNFATIGNIAISEPISVFTDSEIKGFYMVEGIFKNETNENIEANLWFSRTTLNLSNVTTSTNKTPLKINDGNTTFIGETFKYINGNIAVSPEITSENITNLYDIDGNLSSKNPVLIFKDAPKGNYNAYVLARDTGGKSATLLKNIDNILPTPPPSAPSGGGGTTSGSSGSFNPQGNGTYRINQTATPTSTSTAVSPPPKVTPTPTEITTIPQETVIIPTILPTKKKTPGFEIAIAIGAIFYIYMVRKIKLK